jgi:hypothetical protein
MCAVNAQGPASVGRAGGSLGIVDEFRALSQSLEWRVSEAYWHHEGVRPFARKEVPYRANNDGRLSDSAARLLFANCSSPSRSLAATRVFA